MKQYIPITLHTFALLSIAFLLTDHFEYEGIQTFFFAGIATILGYYLGMWTCHLHAKQKGFWITIGIFVLLNGIHSMIDGASVGAIGSFAGAIAMLSHEFARQPALYIILWGMLTPFVRHTPTRLLLVPLLVTGTWLVGAHSGYQLVETITTLPWLESIADMAVFLFLGDILHHTYEEYRKLKKDTTCCHSH